MRKHESDFIAIICKETEVIALSFGYSLMKSRAGAAGYIRENDCKREVTARDLPPGSECALYQIEAGEILLCGTETADAGGNAKWKAPVNGSLFVAANGSVLLWEGGDEAFLLATAWLKKQKKTGKEKTEEIPQSMRKAQEQPAQSAKKEIESGMFLREQTEVYQNQPETTVESMQNQTGFCFESSNNLPPEHWKAAAKESPPEQPYTLRPAGTGEPVDTLPERG